MHYKIGRGGRRTLSGEHASRTAHCARALRNPASQPLALIHRLRAIRRLYRCLEHDILAFVVHGNDLGHGGRRRVGVLLHAVVVAGCSAS